MKKVILLGLLISFLFSCSTLHIEKRRYRKGIHVSLNKHKSNAHEKFVSENKSNAVLTDEAAEVEQPTSNKVVESTNAVSTNKKRLQPIRKVIKQKLKRLKQKEVKYTNSAVFQSKIRSSFRRLETKITREKANEKQESNAVNSAKDQEEEDKHIRSPFARVLLSFLTASGTLLGGLLLLTISILVLLEGATIAAVIWAVIILVVGIYLVLFLSMLAFLNIFRRESERGMSMSKKAAGRAFIIYAIICLLVAFSIFIPFVL